MRGMQGVRAACVEETASKRLMHFAHLNKSSEREGKIRVSVDGRLRGEPRRRRLRGDVLAPGFMSFVQHSQSLLAWSLVFVCL